MKCSQLVEKIERLDPDADAKQVVRVATLMCTQLDAMDNVECEDQFADVWTEVSLRLQAATDQHAAVTEELTQLAQSDPALFTQDQIWILIRAIKVQSQVLKMYAGESACESN